MEIFNFLCFSRIILLSDLFSARTTATTSLGVWSTFLKLQHYVAFSREELQTRNRFPTEIGTPTIF